MSRRFWAVSLMVSLLTVAGGGFFLYKTLLDKSTMTMPLKPVAAAPLEEKTPVPETKPSASESSKASLRNIQFVYINSNAKDVFIVGNFDEKEKTTKKLMQKNRNKWTITLKLEPGTYEYAYLVNGRTVRDPYNKKTSNGKSVIIVNEKPSQAD